jgi:Beta propeller domain
MRRFRSSLTSHHYVRQVAGCATIAHPRQFSGLGMLTILTINLDHGLYTADTDALMADAQVVYGSTGSLYVATQKWVKPSLSVTDIPPDASTVIQRFDVSDPDKTTLVATGEVPGYLLNQFSLSEDGGYLRAATTSRPTWWNGQQVATPSQSYVTVLDEHGGGLTEVGRLSGLGTGQQIFSVRFIGATAYVVTFRKIDPLYVIDVSDPTKPKVAGQLELDGFSSYLQLVGDGLLLGIGTGGGGDVALGTQLELFNVADASAPKLVSKVALGAAGSPAQYDHHGFLFWAPAKLAVLGVYSYGSPIFFGAIGFHIDSSGITEVGRIVHDPVGSLLPAVQRSLVIGNRLFTLSSAGIMASSLDTLTRQSFAAFPQPVTTPVPPGVPVPLAAVSP